MADKQTASSAPSPGGRRQRAPTITIDTSAVSISNPPQDMEHDAVALRALSNSPTTIQGESVSPLTTDGADPFGHRPHHTSSASQASRISIPELRSSGSFDSRESRPTSPHNISSPVSRGQDKTSGFLAVPGLRSRQNSIESDEGNHSSTNYSGETFSNSSQADKDRAFGKVPGNEDVMNDEEALTPDPDTEADFEVVNNSFAFSPGQLNKLINPKSLAAFHALGGLAGLEKGLRSDRKAGLSVDEKDLDGTVSFEQALEAAKKASPVHDYDSKAPLTRTDTKASKASRASAKRAASHPKSYYDRKRVYKDNTLPVKKGKNLFQLMWITYNDKVLILLSIAAAISLAVGLYQTFGTVHSPSNPPIEWVEGVAIIVAIAIVVVVGSLNDWQKERQFVKLNKKKEDRNVNVVRSGRTREISVFDIVVGDVLHIEPGDMIPVDGIFIDGHNVKCDESSITGESDLIRKRPADEVYAAIEGHESLRKMDPFILSGAQITEGVGTFLVTSVGVNSSYGKTLMSLREDPDVTPLQSKLNTLAEYIAKLGGAAGLLLFVVLFIEFLVRLPHNHLSPSEKGQQFLNIFIVTVTIIVVAVPEGLPLAVTLALAFATTRMLKDHNLVRHLKACEVMGNATTICSDKTGTLTQNEMQVVAGTLGTSSRFGGIVDTSDSDSPSKGKQPQQVPIENVTPQEVVSTLSEPVKVMLMHSIAVNSTAFDGDVDGVATFIGSKTETALLKFAKEFLGMGPVDTERNNARIVQVIPFDSGRKCMGVVLETEKGKYRLYVKGASEILLAKCTQIIRDPTDGCASSLINDESRRTLQNLIDNYASRSLRTIGMVYRDFDRWPAKGARIVEGDGKECVFDDIFHQMVLLGIVGIQDPLREGVREAVLKCQKAGVVVRMVTGDNILTAKAIATECGIFTQGGIIMEGPAFRKLGEAKMDQILPRLQVLARSSPEDKKLLVKRLKHLGETVAVTGDGTNDAPALKTADVGFAMGIAGTEVAKEASAIILMDDNFTSIVKAMMWGRAVNDAVKKFLQFQVTVNITAVLLTFITAVSSPDEKSVLTAVQLLWVNLIMDTLAALALATDPPTESILDRKPDPKSAPLITVTMWKMIIGEAIYQLVITLLLYYGSESILSYTSEREKGQINTLVFNTFVWMQIFNQWNNRRLDNKFNIMEGVTHNWFFLVINLGMVGFQVMIIYIGGKAFNVVHLNGAQWAYSIILGFLSIPVGAIIRLIPDELVVRLVPNYLKSRPKAPEVTISDEEEHFSFPQPLARVKEELSFLKKVKGGRLNNLKFKVQEARDQWLPRSRSGSRSRDSVPQTPNGDSQREDSFGTPQPTQPSPDSRKRGRSNRSRSNSALGATAVMAGIIAGSVAGWSPIERNYGDNDSLKFSKANARSELESRDDVEVHPNTKPDDPIISEAPPGSRLPPSQIPELRPSPANLSPPQSPPQNDSRPNS